MRKKRYFMSGARLLFVFGFLSLIGSIILAYTNNFTPLPWSPSTVILVGFVGFIGFITLGAGLMWFDTSWATRLNRHMAYSTPDRDSIVRVVKSDVAKRKEYFVYGAPEETVREVVENDWPFKGKLKSRDWYVVDSKANDVSDKIYSDVEGTLKVVFE